jgi:UDP-N-acetylmuramate dehydrogenase
MGEWEEERNMADWAIKGTVMHNVPMKRYTSMKVGGPAKQLVYPLDQNDLLKILQRLRDNGVTYRFFGNGTNIVVSDRGIDEALIRITRMAHTHFRKTQDGALAEVSGGASLKGFIRTSAGRGLSGLERLFWIPGTVGGAIRMNAASFGASITDTLKGVRIVDSAGQIQSLAKSEMTFGYRTSSVGRTQCVLSAQFSLKERDKKEISADMEYVYGERKKRHPMEFPSAGSIFKGVKGEPAWKFIEAAGLKGLRINDACVSEKHANFIVNLGHAKAGDIKALIERIKTDVFEKCAVSLEEEVELWGFEEKADSLNC